MMRSRVGDGSELNGRGQTQREEMSYQSGFLARCCYIQPTGGAAKRQKK